MADQSEVTWLATALRRALVLATCVLAAGCVTMPQGAVEIRFTSIPEGALVYSSNGKAIGMTPMERIFVPTPELADDVLSEEALIVWPSGASIRQTITIRPRENKLWVARFSRPATAPGLDIDMRHAAALAQARSGPQGTDLSYLLAQFAANYAASRAPALPAGFSLPNTIRCTTKASGWQQNITECKDLGY